MRASQNASLELLDKSAGYQAIVMNPIIIVVAAFFEKRPGNYRGQ